MCDAKPICKNGQMTWNSTTSTVYSDMFPHRKLVYQGHESFEWLGRLTRITGRLCDHEMVHLQFTTVQPMHTFCPPHVVCQFNHLTCFALTMSQTFWTPGQVIKCFFQTGLLKYAQLPNGALCMQGKKQLRTQWQGTYQGGNVPILAVESDVYVLVCEGFCSRYHTQHKAGAVALPTTRAGNWRGTCIDNG